MCNLFSNLSFDTIIGILGLIVGIIGLIVGGKAFVKSQKALSILNSQKTINNGDDYSQNTTGPIINNVNTIEAITALTNQNYVAALEMATKQLNKTADENLNRIIIKTKKIIDEKKLEISNYSKTDWISIYLESAKNSSDHFMQTIWAKMLAKELSNPGSISYKTIDVVKNMSSQDFLLFEKACRYKFGNALTQEESYKNDLKWMELLRLSEIGLLNLNMTTRTISVPSLGTSVFVLSSEYVLVLRNPFDEERKVSFSVHPFSFVGEELFEISGIRPNFEVLSSIAKNIKSYFSDLSFSINRLIGVEGERIIYENQELVTL